MNSDKNSRVCCMLHDNVFHVPEMYLNDYTQQKCEINKMF